MAAKAGIVEAVATTAKRGAAKVAQRGPRRDPAGRVAETSRGSGVEGRRRRGRGIRNFCQAGRRQMRRLWREPVKAIGSRLANW